MKLYTSRWTNPDLKALDVVKVGISRGRPKWPLGYDYQLMPDLYPDGWMLGIEDDEYFEKVYRRKLEDVGVDRIAARLLQISRTAAGNDVVLLCWEDVFRG